MASRADKRKSEKAKRIARQKHERKFGPTELRPPTSFTHAYGADRLQVIGPVIIANWAIPVVLAEQLQIEGKPLTPPVAGALLVDTGASHTCISLAAAEQLGLKPTRMQEGYGAGGIHRNYVYLARLVIRIDNAEKKTSSTLEWEQEVQAIPDLDKHTRLSYQGVPTTLIGLLGRDILRHTRIVWDGPRGEVRYAFDMKSLNIEFP